MHVVCDSYRFSCLINILVLSYVLRDRSPRAKDQISKFTSPVDAGRVGFDNLEMAIKDADELL